MFKRMRLWWQEPTDDDIEREEAADEEYNRLLEEYSGRCPICNSVLYIGITDYTIGRSCHEPHCMYHDFFFRYPELEEL